MQSDVLALVVGLLDEAGIPHMLAGSFANTCHGEPRMTRDIDRGRFYVGDAREAVERRGRFNIVGTKSGWKVDLIIRKERPFRVEEFGRRIPATVEGVDLFVARAEDTVWPSWSGVGSPARSDCSTTSSPSLGGRLRD